MSSYKVAQKADEYKSSLQQQAEDHRAKRAARGERRAAVDRVVRVDDDVQSDDDWDIGADLFEQINSDDELE